MVVWCGEKEECLCVVIHCILGVLMWSVWTVVVEWRERRVVWRKVVEGKRRKEWKNQKHKSNCNSLKVTTHFD